MRSQADFDRVSSRSGSPAEHCCRMPCDWNEDLFGRSMCCHARTRELGLRSASPERPGGRDISHAPKLYIYGYLNRVQSSRRLERKAGRNLEVMSLTGRLVPDHITIADFRKTRLPSNGSAALAWSQVGASKASGDRRQQRSRWSIRAQLRREDSGAADRAIVARILATSTHPVRRHRGALAGYHAASRTT